LFKGFLVWLKVYTQPRIRRFNLKALRSCAPVGPFDFAQGRLTRALAATRANQSTDRPVSVVFTLDPGGAVFCQAATDLFR
jgi:hypothetical protein